MSDAREIKTAGRDLAAQPFGGDGRRRLPRSVQGDEAGHARERGRRRWSRKALYDLGSEYVEGVNAISGERCSPHPHVFSDRMLRPGDPVYYDILHSYMGYRTCYYRTFAIGSASHALIDAYKRCRDYLDAVDRADPARAGRRRKSRRCGRRRRSSASPTKKRRSRCRWVTASAWRSGRSR